MTKEDFLSLPLQDALSVLWELAPTKLGAMKAPPPRPPVGKVPKYDQAIYRKDGIQYASELDMSSLIFWRDKNTEGANDPKYGEKNKKNAKSLDYWIQFRQLNPTTRWQGERNHVLVTAKAPSENATTYPRDADAGTPVAPQNPTPDFDENDDIPF